jgi:hypothetical protein
MGRKILSFTALLLVSGCTAGFYLVGATPHTGRPAMVRATWRIAACSQANGQSAEAPNATYYLDDIALYEVDASGQGARITNSWSDDKGRYFFTRVKTSHGWLYFIPNDATQAPTRQVYLAGAYSVDEQNAVIKPVGTPGVSCTLAAAN